MPDKNKDTIKKTKKDSKEMNEIDSETAGEIDTIQELRFVKAVRLLQSMRSMTVSQSKIEMYLSLANTFSELSEYKESKEYQNKCLELANETQKAIYHNVYQKAQDLKEAAKTVDDFRYAAEEFRKIKEYQNAEKLAVLCDQAIVRMERNYVRNHIIFSGLFIACFILLILLVSSKAVKYQTANLFQSVGSYQSAVSLYQGLGTYQDSPQKLIESQYHLGLQLEDKEDYKNARKAFEAADHYKDSDIRKTNAEKQNIKSKHIGETVKVGACKWYVLKMENGKALLMKKKAMTKFQYNNNYEAVTWEESSIRSYLNVEFIHETFTEEEQKSLVLTDVKNADNPTFGTDGGKDTKDYVYLLSVDDIKSGSLPIPSFSSNTWLRTPGANQLSTVFLSNNGAIMDYGYSVTSEEISMHPVLWFYLD